jgi:hypothetical protein
MKKKIKVVVGIIVVTIAALLVVLLVFTRKKGEWVVYYPDSPGRGHPVSGSEKILVWPQDVNEENISRITFYRYIFRKKVDTPVVRICVLKNKGILSSVEAEVGYFVTWQTEPIVFAAIPSLNGKRIRGNLILFVPPSSKEDIEKHVKMKVEVLEKGETL